MTEERLTGDEINARKMTHHATNIGHLKDGCPLGYTFSACLTCQYTDKVGVCYHPLDINKEIESGRARPTQAENMRWPELIKDYKRRGYDLAFRDVNRR